MSGTGTMMLIQEAQRQLKRAEKAAIKIMLENEDLRKALQRIIDRETFTLVEYDESSNGIFQERIEVARIAREVLAKHKRNQGA